MAQPATARSRTIRVVGDLDQAVPFASVSIQGGGWQLVDANGLLALGPGKRQIVSLTVRRVGFRQLDTKIELPDTAAILTVQLSAIAESLGAVTVTGERGQPSLALTGFYERWLARQKGSNTGVFIGP
jgi:hypothetical protein